MPVATSGAVKAVSVEHLEELGIAMILGNTYHLYLRPGEEVIARAGGLHRFMGWNHNILTDSGGFQIFSLATLRRLEDGGAVFRSHLDGSSHSLTPEKVVALQLGLGSDILMPLDVCTPSGIAKTEAREADRLTFLWAQKSLQTWENRETDSSNGRLFAIVQGNFFKDLRRESAERLVDLGFPGYAIGGLSVGEPFGQFREFLAFTADLLPSSSPRYVMGIGTPDYILEAVENGVDLFDCVYPTRTARNARAFTRRGALSLRREENRFDQRPIDPDCSCSVCRNYTRSYIRHLFKVREILAPMLVTRHNLHFVQELMVGIRRAVRESRFAGFKKDVLSWLSGEEH
jgi:queuine tRNA-ribosyltransferase